MTVPRQPPIAATHPVTIVRHGETFVDPYAWLRERDTPAVREYLAAENAWAEAAMAPQRATADQLFHELVGRIRETDLSVSVRRGAWWYYSRTVEGLQYPIHCRRRGEDGPEEVLLDLNHLAEGREFMALGVFTVSDDGRYLAYATDDTGYRQYTLAIKDLETGALLPFTRPRVTSVSWAADDRTLFWCQEDPTTKRSCELWRGDRDGGEATLVLREADEAFSLVVGRTRSRAWVVIQSGSHTTSEARVLAAAAPHEAPRVLRPRRQDVEYDVEHHGDWWYLRINDTGRNFRLVRVPVTDPQATPEELVAHRTDVMLEGVDCFADLLVCSEREAGITQLTIHPMGGAPPHRMRFPEPVYEAWLHANPEWEIDTLRVGYQSLVTPSSVYDYHLVDQRWVLLKQQEVVGGYDPAAFVSERWLVTAADGAQVPVSLVRRRDVATDGTAPCLLQGYGAYGYPYPVGFSSNRLSLLERGVVIAIAHIRGGGDLGTPWHDAGRMAHKMNTFTDFIACVEALIARGVCAGDRLVIEGGSAGGLLMVTNLRPELFAGVVSQVPFVDVLNTMSDPTLPLTIGEYEEWGNPEVAEEFAWMRAYCPYTNLRSTDYLPMLVRTSLHDSQVMYWEPAKYVARLRALRTNDAPLLLLTNMGAGHGGASGRYDRLREIAADYAWMLGIWGVGSATSRG